MYTVKELDDILAYGPSGSKGEARALAEQLHSCMSEMERLRAQLALPEVVDALTERQRRLDVAQARQVLLNNGEKV